MAQPQRTPSWLRRKYKVIMLLIVFFVVTFRATVNYFKHIEFETVRANISNGKTNGFLHLKYQTRWAIIPDEPIRITAKYIPNPSLLPPSLLSLSFEEALFTDASINKQNDKPDHNIDENTFEYYKEKSKEGVMKLTRAPGNNTLYGEIEIAYQKSGEFEVRVIGQDSSGLDKITVGSTAETMNKKSNDLLFILSVFTFCLFVYIEFIRERSSTK